MTTLERNASEWEENARRNALWAILTDRDQTDRSWDIDEFFETGRTEVALVLDHLATLGVELDFKGCFLDFGCGVGRSSRALMTLFASGIGVDVSQTMIDLARRFCVSDAARPKYQVNQEPGLPAIPSGSIAFVYSHIVLQHIPSDLQPVFIADFLRVLAPGGIAAFQIPTGTVVSGPRKQWQNLKSGVRSALPRPVLAAIKSAMGRDAETAGVSMQMNVLPQDRIAQQIEAAGCELVEAPYTNSTDTSHRGAIRFMSRDEAIGDARAGRTDSQLLSQFFFVRKPLRG